MNKLKENSEFESIIEFTNNGNASVNIEDKNVFIFKKNTLNALNQDKVRVKVFIKNKKVEAEVIQVLERNRTQFVGKVHINKGHTLLYLILKKYTLTSSYVVVMMLLTIKKFLLSLLNGNQVISHQKVR